MERERLRRQIERREQDKLDKVKRDERRKDKAKKEKLEEENRKKQLQIKVAQEKEKERARKAALRDVDGVRPVYHASPDPLRLNVRKNLKLALESRLVDVDRTKFLEIPP